MVYLNITFPEDLKKELDLEVRQERTKRSTLIQKAVRTYLKLKHQKAVDVLLREGYQEMAAESKKVMKDFEKIDRESWKHVD
jgi:metal-responsive CopG/Arc/MetJ family transcriptional regulator